MQEKWMLREKYGDDRPYPFPGTGKKKGEDVGARGNLLMGSMRGSREDIRKRT